MGNIKQINYKLINKIRTMENLPYKSCKQTRWPNKLTVIVKNYKKIVENKTEKLQRLQFIIKIKQQRIQKQF